MGKITVQKIKDGKLCLPRVIRTSKCLFRICSLALMLSISPGILNVTSSYAIETTKASGLVLGKGQDSHSSLSSSQNSCRKHLSSNYAPPKHGLDIGSKSSMDDRATVPVALGIFLGMRIALIPSSASGKIQKSRNVQIGPEIRGISKNGNRHALSIAAFRKCQKEEFLKAGYNNK